MEKMLYHKIWKYYKASKKYLLEYELFLDPKIHVWKFKIVVLGGNG